MKKLTVIIPFLNEGEEVQNTVESIMTHGGDQTEIILINDASTDGYHYKGVAEDYGACYIEHARRQGVAASRDEGVERCTTPYFLVLDGHMRFYDVLWVARIVGELDDNDRQLLCCQTKVLKKGEQGIYEEDRKSIPQGAKIVFYNDKKVMKPEWQLTERYPVEKTVDIACVLGAAYAASKRYWQYLKGLAGLLYYGGDEAYISMKVWLEGGKCRLMNDVVAGHIYRKAFPYPVEQCNTLYNKLWIAELLLPTDLKNQVFGKLQKQYADVYSDSFQQLIENRQLLKELKAWYRQIFTRSFDFIVRLNTSR